MPTINKVIIIGYVGAEPEMRYSQQGKAVTTTSVGTNRFKETDWHKVVSFGDTAEKVNEDVRKGNLVYIEGSVQYSFWEHDGIRTKQTSIIADKIIVIKDRSNDGLPGEPE